MYRGAGGGGALASFDALDVIRGIGYLRYYLARITVDTNSTDYLLVEDTIDGTSWKSTNQQCGVTLTKEFDLDFDIEVEKSFDLEGVAIVNISYGVNSSANQTDFYLICKLVHVDSGATETVLDTVQSATATATGTRQDLRAALIMNITRTKFRPGEKIRLIVEGWGQAAVAAGTRDCYMYFDPTGRKPTDGGDGTHTNHSSVATLDLPFLARQ